MQEGGRSSSQPCCQRCSPGVWQRCSSSVNLCRTPVGGSDANAARGLFPPVKSVQLPSRALNLFRTGMWVNGEGLVANHRWLLWLWRCFSLLPPFQRDGPVHPQQAFQSTGLLLTVSGGARGANRGRGRVMPPIRPSSPPPFPTTGPRERSWLRGRWGRRGGVVFLWSHPLRRGGREGGRSGSVPRAGEGPCVPPQAAGSPRRQAVMGLCPREGLACRDLSAPGRAFADPTRRPGGFGGAFVGLGSYLRLVNENLQTNSLSKAKGEEETQPASPSRSDFRAEEEVTSWGFFSVAFPALMSGEEVLLFVRVAFTDFFFFSSSSPW